MAKHLVVANLTAESPALGDAAVDTLERDPAAESVVLVPIGTVAPWMALGGGADGRVLRRQRATRVRQRLEALGAKRVTVRLGRADPLREVEHTLAEGGSHR